MKDWKVLIELNSKYLTVEIKAESYADAYINVELENPGCEVKSITEIRNPAKEQDQKL